MRILVTGVKGQLGHDVVDEMIKRGLEPVGVDVEEMDITDRAACDKVITEANVDAVIHCAAYTAVDAAEDNVEMCRRINADGTRNVAEVCRKLDIRGVWGTVRSLKSSDLRQDMPSKYECEINRFHSAHILFFHFPPRNITLAVNTPSP